MTNVLEKFVHGNTAYFLVEDQKGIGGLDSCAQCCFHADSSMCMNREVRPPCPGPTYFVPASDLHAAVAYAQQQKGLPYDDPSSKL